MLLLCALVVGSASVWAADVTFTVNVETSNTTTLTKNGISLTASSGIFSRSDNYRIYSGATLTVSSEVGNISKIVFTYSQNTLTLKSGENGSISNDTWTGNTSSVVFNTSGGQVRLTKVVVTYTPSAPSINSEDVNIAADVLSGNISYSITNPDGSTLTATKKSGDWLTVGAVDAENGKVAFTATENTDTENSREAVVTLTYGDATKDVTITQAAAVAKYAVTFSAPSNGTLVVKNGEEPIASGTEVSDGTVLTIVATPANEDYRLTKWEYNAANAGWNDGEGTTYEVTSAVAFRASFEEIVRHTITYNVNGSTTSVLVEDGEPISFAAPESGIPAGYSFLGWVVEANKIDTPTDSDPSANYVTSATSTTDIIYYAVLAKIVSYTTESWEEAALTSMTTTDVFVISNGTYAMNNDQGGSNPPTPVSITVANRKITSEVADSLKWKVSGNATDGYTFYPSGDATHWLYCNTTTSSGSNNNIRVGTGNRKLWKINNNDYLCTKDNYTTRYLSIYNNQDFRGYTNTDNAFVPKFYKYIAPVPTYGGYCTSVKEEITITSVGWATYYSDNALDFTGITALTAYTASKDGDAVIFTQVTGAVPAHTGLLVSGVTTNIPVVTTGTGTSLLEGVTVDTPMDANTIFVLKKGSKGLGFYKNNNNFTVRAHSAYLPADAVAGAREFIWFFDETAGISSMHNSQCIMHNEVYDLQGRRVNSRFSIHNSQLKKGLYIVNGKKVIK